MATLTGPSSTRFLFVGNHLCLDFINTEMIIEGQRTDLLSGWPDLISWLVRAKLLNVDEGKKMMAGLDQAGGERLLTEARVFRAALREMMERIVARKSVPRTAVEAINRLLSQCPGYPQLLCKNGRFERHFHSPAQGFVQFLALLAEAAGDLLCARDLALVRKCQNTACILYFYDTTKNHARRWCSMSVCGNRMKVAAHYRRRRSGVKE